MKNLAVCCLLWVIIAPQTWALGKFECYHSLGDATRSLRRGKEEIKELINRPDEWVYGFCTICSGWCFPPDYDFYFKGGASSFNDFMIEYGAVESLRHRMVIHSGTSAVTIPEEGTWCRSGHVEGLEVPIDWKFRFQDVDSPTAESVFDSHIDLWMGGNVELEKIRIPDSIRIESD